MRATRGNAVIVTVKPWWRSTVLWVGFLSVLGGALDGLLGSPALGSQAADVAFLFKGIVEMLQRYFRTNEPLA